jgi:hypothetical protein
LKKKDELKDKVVELNKELKNDNIQVRFLRLDDTGENYALERESKQQNLAVKFEYSGPLVHHKEMESLNANFKHCMVEFKR